MIEVEYQSFLDDLLTRESSLSPDLLHVYYASNKEEYIEYPEVEKVGNLVRDNAGRPIFKKYSVYDYLSVLSVMDKLPKNYDSAIENLKNIQTNVINAWGFVGYQIGEHILNRHGFYKPVEKEIERDGLRIKLPNYYINLPENHWSNGCREYFYESGNFKVLVNHVNLWKGSFTGKYGIDSFEAFKKYENQTLIMHDLFKNYLIDIQQSLSEQGQCFHKVIDDSSSITISGALAACHLSGVEAVKQYLVTNRSKVDELGTSTKSYFDSFSSYKIKDLSDLLYLLDELISGRI